MLTAAISLALVLTSRRMIALSLDVRW